MKMYTFTFKNTTITSDDPFLMKELVDMVLAIPKKSALQVKFTPCISPAPAHINKINIIKMIRSYTGATLADAKSISEQGTVLIKEKDVNQFCSYIISQGAEVFSAE